MCRRNGARRRPPRQPRIYPYDTVSIYINTWEHGHRGRRSAPRPAIDSQMVGRTRLARNKTVRSADKNIAKTRPLVARAGTLSAEKGTTSMARGARGNRAGRCMNCGNRLWERKMWERKMNLFLCHHVPASYLPRPRPLRVENPIQFLHQGCRRPAPRRGFLCGRADRLPAAARPSGRSRSQVKRVDLATPRAVAISW